MNRTYFFFFPVFFVAFLVAFFLAFIAHAMMKPHQLKG